MANEIKLKRGSGSDPSASDLVVGEPAVRTDTGELFLKKDDNSVAKISGGGGTDGDKGDITVSNSGATFTIDAGVIADGNIASNAAISASKISGVMPTSGGAFTGNVSISDNAIEFDSDSGNTNKVSLQGPSSLSTNITLTLPNTDGTNLQGLKTDGSGNLFFGNVVKDNTEIISLYDQTSPTPIQKFLASSEGVTVLSTIANVGKLMFRDRTTANFLKFKPVDTLSAGVEFTLPAADGSANTVLKTDGSGVMSFGTIVTDSITDLAVSTGKIANDAVTNDKLADDSVDTAQIADNAVQSAQIVANAVTALEIANTTIIDGNISTSAAIAGTKIDPDFGSQNIITTGDLSVGNQTITSTAPSIQFTDSDSTPNYQIKVDLGAFAIRDASAGVNRLTVASTGEVSTAQKLNCNGGLDTDGDVKFNSGTTNANILFDASDMALEFDDSVKATFGFDADFKIYHDGSNSYLQDSGTGNLNIDSSLVQVTNGTGNAQLNIRGGSNDGTAVLQFITDDADANNDNFRFISNASNAFFLQNYADGAWETNIKAVGAGTVEIYHDNGKKFETTSSGVTVSGTCTATTFSGSGASLTSLNASNISSGTIAAARVPTLNQDTTGSAELAQNVHVNANNSTNETVYPLFVDGSTGTQGCETDTALSYNPNSNILSAGTFSGNHSGNGSGLTSVDANTLDSIDSGSFVRSDADDSLTGIYNFNATGSYPIVIGDTSGAHNAHLLLRGSDSPYIQFREQNTNKAYIQWNSGGYLHLVNEETSEGIKIANGSSGLVFTHGGTDKTVWHSGNDGSGSGLDADTLDGIDSSAFLRSDTGDLASGDIQFNGGAGAVTIKDGSDIRLESGTWTGNAYSKIQHHNNSLYIQGGSQSYSWIFRYDGSDRVYIKSNGDIVPATDSASDLGTSGTRWANVYADTLYGDGSNLTGITSGLSTSGGTLTGTLNARSIIPTANNTYDLGSSSNRWANLYINDMHFANSPENPNQVDGTWGDWTLQEAEDTVYMLNNRNGKKFKMVMQEIIE